MTRSEEIVDRCYKIITDIGGIYLPPVSFIGYKLWEKHLRSAFRNDIPIMTTARFQKRADLLSILAIQKNMKGKLVFVGGDSEEYYRAEYPRDFEGDESISDIKIRN